MHWTDTWNDCCCKRPCCYGYVSRHQRGKMKYTGHMSLWKKMLSYTFYCFFSCIDCKFALSNCLETILYFKRHQFTASTVNPQKVLFERRDMTSSVTHNKNMDPPFFSQPMIILVLLTCCQMLLTCFRWTTISNDLFMSTTEWTSK